MAGRKPKNKQTLTLHFDTKIGRENFIAWYLDGGGEQQSKYYSDSWGKDWMYVKASDDACPKCESDETEDVLSNFYCKRSLREVEHTCRNCNTKFKIKNPYSENGD